MSQNLNMFTRVFVLLSAATLLSAVDADKIDFQRWWLKVTEFKRIEGDGRIYGGVDTSIKTIPWQVSLQINGAHFCGGAIYSSNIIVTAAHCIYDKDPSSISVRVGTDAHNLGGETVGVSAKVVHANFSNVTYVNDVALLLLSSSLELNDNIRPIRLAKSEPKAGDSVLVSGWGQTETEHTSSDLKSVTVSIVDRKKCAEVYGDVRITNVTICAASAGKDACKGDSGGPLVHRGKLVGIVSFGKGCALPNYPGVYSNVAVLRKWIVEKAKKLQTSSE